MRNFILLFSLLTLYACSEGEKIKTNLPKPTQFKDKASYMIGYDIGMSIVRDSLKVNLDYIILGFHNAFKGDTTFLSRGELDTFRMEFQKFIIENQEKRRKIEEQKLREQAPKNLAEGKAFLDSNKNKPGVITTESGLQYIVLKEGTGKTPKVDDFVKIHVVGKYLNGKEFDNTYSRGPVTIPLNQQAQGWREAITHMREGSKWRIFLPPHLGWGEMGAPPTIPPNATLIFEIELLSIEKPRSEQ
ncbi:MAG: FKBP-type peptidyl-prolyl cis-trans isomerase [Candidatus Kapaibacteriales bacterium]